MHVMNMSDCNVFFPFFRTIQPAMCPFLSFSFRDPLQALTRRTASFFFLAGDTSQPGRSAENVSRTSRCGESWNEKDMEVLPKPFFGTSPVGYPTSLGV